MRVSQRKSIVGISGSDADDEKWKAVPVRRSRKNDVGPVRPGRERGWVRGVIADQKTDTKSVFEGSTFTGLAGANIAKRARIPGFNPGKAILPSTRWKVEQTVNEMARGARRGCREKWQEPDGV